MKKIALMFVVSLLSLSANATLITGTTKADIYTTETSITAYNTATVTTHTGANISYLEARDNSTLNIKGGNISWLNTYNASTTNISFVDSLSWLIVADNSVVNIFASNFAYSSGHLSGVWSNGRAFSFWALEGTDLYSGKIGNLIPDNIVLHNVPVPESSTIALLMIGLLSLVVRRNFKAA